MPNTGVSVYLERESRCHSGNERLLEERKGRGAPRTAPAPRTNSRKEQRARPGAGVPVEPLTMMQSSGIAAPELNRCRNHPISGPKRGTGYCTVAEPRPDRGHSLI